MDRAMESKTEQPESRRKIKKVQMTLIISIDKTNQYEVAICITYRRHHHLLLVRTELQKYLLNRNGH